MGDGSDSGGPVGAAVSGAGSVDGDAVRAASAVLRAAPPELLAQAVPRHEAAALAVAMAELLRG